MRTIATVNAVILAIVGAIAIYVGFDPKKWQTWLLSLYAFLSFFLVGMVGTGNFYDSVAVGAIVTLAMVIVGVTTYWNRERAKKWLKEHGEDEE